MTVQSYRLTIPLECLITAVFAIFFVLLPLIFNNQVIETTSLPRHIFIAGMTSLLILLFAIQLYTNKQSKFQFSRIHVVLFVFYCWAVLSALWSLDPENSMTELTQLTSYFLILFISSQLLSIKQIKKILLAVYIGASIAAVIGLLQIYNINPLELKTTTPLGTTFNNKNHAAVYFDLVIPLAMISMLTTKSYSKYISGITYTLVMTFILLSKTKGSILGFLVFTLVFMFLIYKNDTLRIHLLQKKEILRYMLLTLIIPVVAYITVNNTVPNHQNNEIPSSWNAGLMEKSSSIRLSWYKNAYYMFKENSLTGVGYGAFRKGFSPYASSPNLVKSVTEDRTVAQLHNEPYQIVLELGLIGGVLVIFIFSLIIIKSISTLSSIKAISENKSEYLLLGTLLALISSITHSFVDFPLRLPSSAILFWFISGITLFILYEVTGKINKHITTYTANKFGSIIVLLFFVLFSLHNINFYSRYYSASKLQYEATALMIKDKMKDKTNCPIAKTKIDRAMYLFHESHSIRHRYAQIYSYCDASTKIKLSAMNHVLNYDTSHSRARLTRALLYFESKHYKLASMDFRFLIQTLPHRPAAYLGMGDIATLAKRYNIARKYYETAQELDPKNKHAAYILKQFNDNNL